MPSSAKPAQLAISNRSFFERASPPSPLVWARCFHAGPMPVVAPAGACVFAAGGACSLRSVFGESVRQAGLLGRGLSPAMTDLDARIEVRREQLTYTNYPAVPQSRASPLRDLMNLCPKQLYPGQVLAPL